MKISIPSPEHMHNIGAFIGSHLPLGTIIALEGELGVGKTVFARGVAQALAIEGPITSPSFQLFSYHTGKHPLCHGDFYRLQRLEEWEILGGMELFPCAGLTVLEWPQLLKVSLQYERCVWITITLSSIDCETEVAPLRQLDVELYHLPCAPWMEALPSLPLRQWRRE